MVVMFALAAGKRDTGERLADAVLCAEARVRIIDGALAAAVPAGVGLDGAAWWWADPLAAFVIVVYALREARRTWTEVDHA